METGQQDRYSFETFESDSSSFDCDFTGFLNGKYSSGWKCKDCQYGSSAQRRWAYCLFKKK